MIKFRAPAQFVRVLALAAFLLAAIQTASADPQWKECNLINHTDRTISEALICVSGQDINEVGEAIFAGEPLQNGEGFNFLYNAERQYYHFRIVFDNGDFVDWEKVDCDNMSKITFFKDGANYREQVN